MENENDQVFERKLSSGIPPSTVGKGFFDIATYDKHISESKSKLKVVCILDKFSYDSLSYEVDLHPLPKKTGGVS